MRQLAVDDVEVGPADAADIDLDANFTRSRRAIGKFRQGQRRSGRIQHHRLH